jgi:hypothetical protein
MKEGATEVTEDTEEDEDKESGAESPHSKRAALFLCLSL